MTNKKFKVAAMSMALTACVAAQPLIANAADENINSNDANVNESQSEGESTASAPVAAASVSSDPVTNQQSEGAVDVIGDPDISVDYNHDNDKVTKDDSSTTTESTGPVNRDVPKESEPGAQQPSGDGQQDGNHETDLNNEQKGEPETDLNNEQEGPKDGGSETEKKPIGDAKKSETETKDTELVLSKPTTTTTTTTNPDGSTTTTTTTTTDAALETTTKVEGEASAKTEEDSSEDVKKESLKEELDGKDLSWDTKPDTKFGDYTVTGAVEKDGKKEFTLTKEDKIETGKMTGLDISKLIEAGYTDNGDGTYTLTKEYTDSQGQKQTTTVKVDSSKATKTTSTTLYVTMESQEHEKTEELGTKEDTNYPYPSTDITVKDDKGKEHTFNVTYILGKAHENKDGTFTYEDKENNLTYTITKNETDTKLDSLTDTELRDLLNDHAGSEKYTLDNEGNLCYITDKGEKCRVTDEQNALLRSVLKLGITITDHHGKESDTQKVDGSEKTPEQAKADAEKAAQDEALKDALAQAINKETGKSLTKADITLPEVRDGKFEWTDTATRKTYTFIYTETGTVSSSPEKISDPTTVKPNASSAEKNTETGSAEVTGSTVIWTDKDQTFIQNDEKTDSTFGKDFDFRSVPGGFELDGEAELNEDGTLKSFKTKDGKTYEFRYEKGSAPEDLKDISNPNFTKVTWTMTEKKVDSITSPDTSEPTHIEIERNFQKTEENGTFTFTETKKGGKTYSGLKKVAGTDNVYSNDDGTVTITVSTSTLGTEEIKAALEGKGYTDVIVNSDGNASYKDGNVTYNVKYNTTVETITVKTKEAVEDSRFTISVSDTNQKEAEAALKAKIAELQADLKEGEYIKVNGERFDRHTEIETIIRAFTTAMNYKNMSDDEIVAMLKKQKDDADAEHKSYTGAGIGHDYWGRHYDTGETPNYIGHLDLATDSDLLLEDGKTTADAILLNEGDKKFKFEWNESAEDLVNKDIKDKRAKFQDSISYDDGKQNGGDGSKGHYEYERQDTGSWIAPDSNNYPHESAYYRLTGTIAYNSLENGKEYGTKRAAEKALEKWRAEHPDAEDYKPNIVALTKTETDWLGIEYETTVYKAYTYESSLTAYGYMSKDSNTCVNSGYGDTGYGRAWAGGFDLRISGLTQVTKTESSAHGKNYYDYYADITKYKTVEQTSRPLANRLLDVIPGTKTVPTETTNTDTGSGLFGSYDQDHREDHNYEKPFTGAGTAEYTTYRTWADTNAEWDGEFEKLTGAFGFNYTTTKDAEVTEASKKACVKTDSSVKYHYSYVERQELDPITETKTVTTPADDDGDDDDGGDKIIEEKDHDSPVLPGTPELPPVQDAKPDAPVLPADPALPAVQDAHALPQTGVNWLAAIGLALSGMTLMITGAFASLLGKNAKH
ncbi:hypothetical protein ABI138_04405 [Faecalibacterium prausnitzii]|uniref:hypothetical protein n=1 Tax=Faecalibacterium TaxID=216851 RepID=UPI0032AF1B76